VSPSKFEGYTDVELVVHAVTYVTAGMQGVFKQLVALRSLLEEKGVLEEGELSARCREAQALVDIATLVPGTDDPADAAVQDFSALLDELKRRFVR
jgi:hypothetical protein